MGAIPEVPAVLLPKTGGGTARFDDCTVVTAAAEDVASGKIFVAADGTITTGTGSGGSGWTKIASAEFNVSTTSTTASDVGTISLGSAYYTKNKIIYVKVRDKVGKREGYFYGTDVFFINFQDASGSTSSLSTFAVLTYRYLSSVYQCYSGYYGVYGYSINSSGTLTLRKRYSSTYSRTINSTYVVEVYAADPPVALFD